jgi:hypothetical protein
MRSEHARRQQRDARGRFASAVAHAPEATAALGIPSAVDPTPEATAALGIPSAVDPTPEATAALGIPSAVDPTPEAIAGGGIHSPANRAAEASARRSLSATERALRASARREVRSGSGSGVVAKKKFCLHSGSNARRDVLGKKVIIELNSSSSDEDTNESSSDESGSEVKKGKEKQVNYSPLSIFGKLVFPTAHSKQM